MCIFKPPFNRTAPPPGEFDEDDDDMFGMMGGGFPGMYDNIVGDDVPIADDAKQEL